MNAHCSFIGLLKRALRENDVENYTRLHKIENLYTHKFFEYSDWVDTHPEIENQYIKSTVLMALCSELGRYSGYLKHEMKNAGLECDEIIVWLSLICRASVRQIFIKKFFWYQLGLIPVFF